MKRLLDVLREDLHLTGTKEGYCGEGVGVRLLLRPHERRASQPPASSPPCKPTEPSFADHPRQVAIDKGQLHPIQQCFLERGGAQCGICTPGMIMATHHLLQKHPQPTLLQIQEGLNGNLCRCTGYIRIFESVQQVPHKATIEPGPSPLWAWVCGSREARRPVWEWVSGG